MIYVEAVRKVFNDPQGGDLGEVKTRAYKAGYDALSFNGVIYITVGDGSAWVKTPFIIQDFAVSL